MDTAGAKAAIKYLPEEFRNLEPNNPVNDPTCLLSVYQIMVDFSGAIHAGTDTVSCDLIEENAVHFSRFTIQLRGYMPGNGFTFPIRICCYIDRWSVGRRFLQLFDDIFFLGQNFIFNRKIVGDIYPKVLFGEIFYMAVTCQNAVFTT